ncbi:PREDICTED: uncharacterized protein LOC109583952 [Amphimedon queenslandica]|uniref:Transposable element P transposase-like RNase H domain-containing protein n=1 Tax=Amphimedon queenslandica TaxID=400682 RepID=A0AAN0JE76_AMPQE|nr:PREDICTED: uncharacterized protein LOC109583952 [Amphimedon queenslandica]|eukprot:XP_019855057.1 PREDICTED: uncharacterized protein LOC109583952 [Amphimedon queenslandica]
MAVRLASEAYFGKEVLQKSTVYGQQSNTPLPEDKVRALKKKILSLHPNYVDTPVEFEPIWTNKAYETIRDSGCIALPSQRTLRDYSNAVKAEAGFSSQVDNQLLLASKLMTSAKYHNLIVVLIDEMHIREDLVYNKHTGNLVGFTDIGDINNHLMRFKKSLDSENTPPPLAKSMVSFMVKGLFTSLKFPYAQFPCVSLVGEQLFPLFWEAVFRLERIGFKVIATTFDGTSVNRRLVALHDLSDKLVYKILNIHAEEKRYIYCFSDPPHLIKTVRNCFASKKQIFMEQWLKHFLATCSGPI